MERKPGGYRKPSVAPRVLSGISAENHPKWFPQIWSGLTGASTRHHPAPYPLELAKRNIERANTDLSSTARVVCHG